MKISEYIDILRSINIDNKINLYDIVLNRYLIKDNKIKNKIRNIAKKNNLKLYLKNNEIKRIEFVKLNYNLYI